MDKKLGYYVVDGLEFSSKIQGALHSLKTRKRMSWNFNDEVFEKHDWSVEPQESLDDLYDRRARELREKYDYIMLSYSGGSDSHNILMSFLRQGLLIDELVINTMQKATDKFTDINPENKKNTNAAAEYYLQTVPRLKELENQLSKTKITVLDMTDSLFNSLESAGDASWVLTKKEQINIAGMTRFNYIHFDNVRKNFDKGKKIALVVGLEKPRTYIKDGDFYLMFNDRAANIITVAEHIKDYTNSTVELFYWSPDSVKIIAKQIHIIKKWLEAFPEKQPLWLREKLTPELYRTVHERILRTLIYTTWDDSWYQADKAVKDWYSEFDQWFYENFNNTKAFHIWNEGINYVKTELKPYVKFEDDGQADGLEGYHKHYKVGPMKRLL